MGSLRRAGALVLGVVVASGAVALACGGAYDGNDPLDVLPSAQADAGSDARSDATSAPAEAGASDAGVSAGPSWLLYAWFEQTESWGDPIPIDQFFGSSPDAPPRRDLRAMTFIAPLGRLLVVDAAGKLHVRKGPAWMPVKNVKDVFTTLGDVIPTTVYYVPQGDGGVQNAGLTFLAGNRAYLFDYSASDVAVATGTPITLKDQAGGPPQGTVTPSWDWEVFDTSKYGKDAAWAYISAQYGDEVWRLDGAAVWTKWTGASYPLFAKPGSPPRDRIREAFRSEGDRIVYMVVEPK